MATPPTSTTKSTVDPSQLFGRSATTQPDWAYGAGVFAKYVPVHTKPVFAKSAPVHTEPVMYTPEEIIQRVSEQLIRYEDESKILHNQISTLTKKLDGTAHRACKAESRSVKLQREVKSLERIKSKLENRLERASHHHNDLNLDLRVYRQVLRTNERDEVARQMRETSKRRKNRKERLKSSNPY